MDQDTSKGVLTLFLLWWYYCMWKWKCWSLSCVLLFVTPRTIACQAPLSMGFSRQEYWSGLPFPSPGDPPDPGTEPRSPALQADCLPSEPPRNPDTTAWQHPKLSVSEPQIFISHSWICRLATIDLVQKGWAGLQSWGRNSGLFHRSSSWDPCGRRKSSYLGCTFLIESRNLQAS